MPDQEDELVRELYSRYRRPLFGYVLRSVGGDHQLAEDVVQETLLRAWRNARTLSVDEAGPWLYTVAKNLVVSGYRRQSARPDEVPLLEQERKSETDEVRSFCAMSKSLGRFALRAYWHVDPLGLSSMSWV